MKILSFSAEIEDPSGINLSGIGLGHDMTINIDKFGIYRICSNDYFDPQSGTYGKGTVMYEIPELEDGYHTLTFKVWDTESNSSRKTITFSTQKGIKRIFSVYVSTKIRSAMSLGSISNTTGLIRT